MVRITLPDSNVQARKIRPHPPNVGRNKMPRQSMAMVVNYKELDASYKPGKILGRGSLGARASSRAERRAG